MCNEVLRAAREPSVAYERAVLQCVEIGANLIEDFVDELLRERRDEARGSSGRLIADNRAGDYEEGVS